MTVALIQLARTRRLRALRYLHREGLETRNVFATDPSPDRIRERLPRGAGLSGVASMEKHAKVVPMVR
ncbi:hypothetical protein [Cereibacter sediminicola]|uniref:hypothetical protein n=1 Tax=Cereibacter sediminicola TaxID=2584941 RepID=UPI0011A123CA|nr:hypothetical protein [Cereibacter sediminicola]